MAQPQKIGPALLEKIQGMHQSRLIRMQQMQAPDDTGHPGYPGHSTDMGHGIDEPGMTTPQDNHHTARRIEPQRLIIGDRIGLNPLGIQKKRAADIFFGIEPRVAMPMPPQAVQSNT